MGVRFLDQRFGVQGLKLWIPGLRSGSRCSTYLYQRVKNPRTCSPIIYTRYHGVPEPSKISKLYPKLRFLFMAVSRLLNVLEQTGFPRTSSKKKELETAASRKCCAARNTATTVEDESRSYVTTQSRGLLPSPV